MRDVPAHRRAVIAGIGHTEFSQHSGRSTLQLAAEASLAAIRDAGMTPADIDGNVTFAMDTNDELALIRSLGIPELRYSARTRGGGGGACSTIQLAAAAVESGHADAVLVYRAFNERSGHRFGQPQVAPNPDPAWNQHKPYGLDTPAKIYALAFQRYMHEFGVTNPDLGRYTVVARDGPAPTPTPGSTTTGPSRSTTTRPAAGSSSPSCASSTAATRATAAWPGHPGRAGGRPRHRARRHPLGHGQPDRGRQRAVRLLRPGPRRDQEAAAVGRRLYAESGLTPADIDVAMIYENFTPVVFLQLEAMGLCGPGEARDFIADGHIDLDGSMPVNTHGGLLGEAYIHGMNNIVEGVRQLRGTSYNQISDAQHVLVSAGRSGLVLGRHS